MHSDKILEKAQLNYGYKNINGWPDKGQDLLIAKRSEEAFGAIEMFYILIMVTVTLMHTFKENASNIIFHMGTFYCR